VPLADVKEIKTTTAFRSIRMSNVQFRPPIRAAPFGHIGGLLPPSADPTDSPTLLAGAMKRFLFKPPIPDTDLLKRLQSFTERFLAANLSPLPATTDISFDSWVSNINHPETRKEELRTLWNGLHRKLDPKHASVKQFMKDESYSSFKHGRSINSRHDAFKCATGPWFSAIEKEVFKLKWFIKYIPVLDRPKALFERLYRVGATYYSSDFTSFESLFTPELMEAVEMQLYRYMTVNLPDRQVFYECLEMIKGRNNIGNKWFQTTVDGTRMSGEMNTSLGNGFANLMFWLFLCEEKGASCEGFVEGDDGIFSVVGAAPTADDFARLGLVVKIEEHTRLNTASFCGNVFDEIEQTQITDPRYAAINLFWIPGKYAHSKRSVQMALLRSKALSLHHQYPKHPILTALSKRILFLTRSYDVRKVLQQGFLDEWERNKLTEAMRNFHPEDQTVQVPLANRLLVEELYGVTSHQQLLFEDRIAKFELGDVIPVDWTCDEAWSWFYQDYVTQAAGKYASTPGSWPCRFPCKLPVQPDFQDPGAGWDERFCY